MMRLKKWLKTAKKKGTEEEAEEANDFDGKTLETDEYTIEIIDHKVIESGEEGNEHGDKPILAFWFNTTVHEDVTDSDIDPNIAWISVFEALQDNDPDAVNELDVGSLPDETHLDSQTQTIKPGGTVESSVSYELDDLETPVILTAGEMLGDEYGSHEYSLD